MAMVALTAMAIYSCDEDTQNIGQSLTQESDKLDVTTESFEVTTRTYIADSVFTLSNNCYLGNIRDPETQTDVKSEFATQYHLLDKTTFAPENVIVSRYDDKPAADSCSLTIYLSNPFNSKDSLFAMKMKIHELKTTMEEGIKYYSNYNPIKLGMVREGGLSKNKMFTYRKMVYDNESYDMGTISIPLNEPYTADDGTQYNNYGTYIMRQYYEHPEFFRNSYAFSHHVCPGFFFQITDGYGFHAKVSHIGLSIYYRAKNSSDEVVNSVLVAAGTKEVLQATLVTNDRQAINKLANETTHTYLKSPAGLFTEVTLPIKAIKTSHSADSLIAAKVSFLRLNDMSDNERMFSTPKQLLMIPEDSLSSFFENNQVPDSRLTYYTTFNYIGSTYANNNAYTYSNISALITALWNIRQAGMAQDPNWEAKHPNWDKVLLVPITYNSSSSTRVEHDMTLTSTRLVGGPDNNIEPIKISVVYAKFNN